jgi:hypothetical protein
MLRYDQALKEGLDKAKLVSEQARSGQSVVFLGNQSCISSDRILPGLFWASEDAFSDSCLEPMLGVSYRGHLTPAGQE